MSTRSDRLYEHFQRERTAFHRWVIAAVSVCTFYAVVFRPYLATLSDLADNDVELGKQAAQIAEAQQEIETMTRGIQRATDFMGDASAYVALYEEAETWVSSLDQIEQQYDRQARRVARLRDALEPHDRAGWERGKIPGPALVQALRRARPELMQGYEPSDDCFFRIEEDWVRCQVDGKLQPIRERLGRVLYDRTDSHELTRKLELQISANRDRYLEGLGEAIRRAELAGWVRAYLQQERAIIRAWYEDTARERLTLQRRADEQQKLRAENERKRVALEDRKREISAAGRLDTPIGVLPLSFRDIVMVVPLVMLATGLLLLRTLRRMLLLRGRFEAEGPPEETDPEMLRLTMPLWLDPLDGLVHGLVAFVVLLIPGVAALAGTVQLMTSRRFETEAGSLTTIDVSLAAVALAIGYAFASFRLVSEWQTRSHRS